MKINSKTSLLLAGMLSSCLFISGCNNTIEVNSDKITLIKGAVTSEYNGEYTNYNLSEGKYNKLDVGKIVVAYDIVSGNYIYAQNEKMFVQYFDKKVEIVDEDITDIKISPSGEYISYFKREKYMELVIIELKNNKRIDLKSEVAISGNLMDWTNKNKILYYGINESKNNAIFSYDLLSGKEEIIYMLNNGYIEFIKTYVDGVIFVQESVDGIKSLKTIDNKNKVNVLTNELKSLKDVLVTEKGIYILGEMNNDIQSIYEVYEGNIKRLIYDFPNIIHFEKGLSYDESGNVLFIGGTDSFNKEKIYTYDNGYVKSLTNEDSKYYFVDIK